MSAKGGEEILDKVIGIKVDIDTSEGMKHGVPRLLELFKRYGICASFFAPMGKDHTGRTVKRVFTRKGFLKKAGRVGVLSTYGVKTLLYGIILPGPEIAKRNSRLLHKIIDDGHELGIHGYDHVYWHDYIKALGRDETDGILRRSVEVYRETVGDNPKSFAAPGWMVNGYALKYFENNGFVYTSNARGRSPFYPMLGGDKFSILEVPSTLPTLDEVVGLEGTDMPSLAEYFFHSLRGGLNIMTVHTELEGKNWLGFFETFLKKSLEAGFLFKKLIDIALENKAKHGPEVSEMRYGSVEGRAGEVCVQI